MTPPGREEAGRNSWGAHGAGRGILVLWCSRTGRGGARRRRLGSTDAQNARTTPAPSGATHNKHGACGPLGVQSARISPDGWTAALQQGCPSPGCLRLRGALQQRRQPAPVPSTNLAEKLLRARRAATARMAGAAGRGGLLGGGQGSGRGGEDTCWHQRCAAAATEGAEGWVEVDGMQRCWSFCRFGGAGGRQRGPELRRGAEKDLSRLHTQLLSHQPEPRPTSAMSCKRGWKCLRPRPPQCRILAARLTSCCPPTLSKSPLFIHLIQLSIASASVGSKYFTSLQHALAVVLAAHDRDHHASALSTRKGLPGTCLPCQVTWIS